MDYQECIWKNKYVWVVSIMSKNRVIHRYLKKYVGKGGFVIGTSKNNMLLVSFEFWTKDYKLIQQTRCIPASCVVEYGKAENK